MEPDSGAGGDVRLLGVSEDGASLRLAEGPREFALPIDDRLRAAVNGHLSRLGQLSMATASHISPRDIQARVRAGESAEQVAGSAGVALDHVLRFVGPVLREREHAAETARAARIAREAPGPAPLLGDVVDHALQRRGVSPDDADWDAAKSDDGTWIVTVSWVSVGKNLPSGSARWRFDVTRRQAEALDAQAREFAGQREPEAPDAAPDADDAGTYGGDGSDRNGADAVTPFVPRLAPTYEPEAYEPEAAGTENDAGEPKPEPESAPPPAAPGRRGRGSRRAAIPTWDDIVFGIKPPDSGA